MRKTPLFGFPTRSACLIYFALVVGSPVCAQRLPLRHYDIADGLAHGTVSSVYQDSKGYIWFGTYEGLSRFDGYRFVSYDTRDGFNQTRAQVLRAVAEDVDLFNAESNRAFVLMQYFGYLRRNPNDPQDTDYTGFDFWLTKLNQFNGNFINAEMVKAFITSSECRGRFGP